MRAIAFFRISLALFAVAQGSPASKRNKEPEAATLKNKESKAQGSSKCKFREGSADGGVKYGYGGLGGLQGEGVASSSSASRNTGKNFEGGWGGGGWGEGGGWGSRPEGGGATSAAAGAGNDWNGGKNFEGGWGGGREGGWNYGGGDSAAGAAAGSGNDRNRRKNFEGGWAGGGGGGWGDSSNYGKEGNGYPSGGSSWDSAVPEGPGNKGSGGGGGGGTWTWDPEKASQGGTWQWSNDESNTTGKKNLKDDAIEMATRLLHGNAGNGRGRYSGYEREGATTAGEAAKGGGGENGGWQGQGGGYYNGKEGGQDGIWQWNKEGSYTNGKNSEDVAAEDEMHKPLSGGGKGENGGTDYPGFEGSKTNDGYNADSGC